MEMFEIPAATSHELYYKLHTGEEMGGAGWTYKAAYSSTPTPQIGGFCSEI